MLYQPRADALCAKSPFYGFYGVFWPFIWCQEVVLSQVKPIMETFPDQVMSGGAFNADMN